MFRQLTVALFAAFMGLGAVARGAGKEPALPQHIAIPLGESLTLEMVLVPAGEFLMGSSGTGKNAFNGEHPQHRVRITRPFYLGKYAVTQEQWEALMGSNPSLVKGPKHPVEQVSWKDCQGFLRRLGEKAEIREFVLPTEAQWEYACLAGSTTSYYFGDDEAQLGEYAWYAKNSEGKTHQVGEKKPNAWGLYDMHGNVREWCLDWFDDSYYRYSPEANPRGPFKGVDRVNRGGSYNDESWYCRAACRSLCATDYRSHNLGFRVALVTPDILGE